MFGYTNPIRPVREPPLPSAGQGQGEDETGQGQYGYDEHREGEAGVIRDEAEQRRPDSAEPDGEPHRYAGREPDTSLAGTPVP